MKDYLNSSAPTHFIFPIDGDFVNANDGKKTADGITFTASVSSVAGCKVTVNGVDIHIAEKDEALI